MNDVSIDIDAVRIVPTWIILMSEVENLAPRLLICQRIDPAL